eukprot:GHRQ01028756.1.p2 GENE.GHRQ01028756.1~~GHRQ01028756.1.p2  ORF type:complete len:105 (-),score=16.68 GHRQ01028756.1:267-581(-)
MAVVGVNVSGFGLQGSLPAGLSALSSLQVTRSVLLQKRLETCRAAADSNALMCMVCQCTTPLQAHTLLCNDVWAAAATSSKKPRVSAVFKRSGSCSVLLRAGQH